MTNELKQALRAMREAKGEMERRIEADQPIVRINAVQSATLLRDIAKVSLEMQKLIGRVPVHKETTE